MNVAVLNFFTFFCLIAVALSFKIGAKNKNRGEGKDYEIEDYESYSHEPEMKDDDGNKENNTNNFSYIKNYNHDRNIAFGFQIPVDEGKSLAVKEPHYISIFAGNLNPGAGSYNLPHENEKEIALQINPGLSSLQEFQIQKTKDKNSKEFEKLLCLADCKMVDTMAFNIIKNHGGNGTFPWLNIQIAGRPYTFATLADWCSKNCGTSMGWEIPADGKHSLRPPDDNLPNAMTNEEKPDMVIRPANMVAPQLFFPMVGQQNLQPRMKQHHHLQTRPKLQNQQQPLDTPTAHSSSHTMYQIPKSRPGINHGSGVVNLNAVDYSDVFKMPILGGNHYGPEKIDFDNGEFDLSGFKNVQKDAETGNIEVERSRIDPKTLDLKNGMKYRAVKVAKYIDSPEDEHKESFDEEYLNEEEDYDDYDDNEYDNIDGSALNGDGCTGERGAILQILQQVSKILSNEIFRRLSSSLGACEDNPINGEDNGKSGTRKVLDLFRFPPSGRNSKNHDTAKERIP